MWTVGLDLSMALLTVAREESPTSPYVRGDMRVLPFETDCFDLVVNLFTSFGYFATDEENRQVLREVHRVSKRGASFVLDYLNADQVRSSLVPMDRRRVGSRMVTQRRAITPDGKYVEKFITATGCDTEYMERVRLFEPDELRCVLGDAGFEIDQEFGSYAQDALTADSPRAVFFAHAA